MGQNGMGNHDETTLQGNMNNRERRHATPAGRRFFCYLTNFELFMGFIFDKVTQKTDRERDQCDVLCTQSARQLELTH